VVNKVLIYIIFRSEKGVDLDQMEWTFSYISLETQSLAEWIMNYISQDCTMLEYHSTNAQILRRWWKTKVTMHMQFSTCSSIQGMTTLPKYTHTQLDFNVDDLTDLRRTLTQNLQTFRKILNSVELWTEVLSDKLWDHFENGGIIDTFIQQKPVEVRRTPAGIPNSNFILPPKKQKIQE
jgi:hypothetical protein